MLFKKLKKQPVLQLAALFLAVCAIVMTACSDGGLPPQDKTPEIADYTFDTEYLNQDAGSVTAVTVTKKDNASPGTVTVYYTGINGTDYLKSDTVPQTAGTYAVTFEVAAATGWEAATLEVGNLIIRNPDFSTPAEDDYTISVNLQQTAGSVTAVTVTKKDNTKSPGQVTVYYTGINGTSYPKSQTVPQAAGTYAVTFDVAGETGWNPASDLEAGILTVLPIYSYTITFDKNGGDTEANPTTRMVTHPAATIDALPTEPARTGYNFTGWNTEADGSGSPFTVTTPVTESKSVYAQWTPVVPSSNANIRAVSGSGATALYGLYYGGMPGIDNGTPQATADNFSTNATAITLSGNNPTDNPSRNVVVIVEDKKVSKVEFGVNTASSGTTAPGNTAPSTWYTLTRNNDFTTPDTVDKRWVGLITISALTGSSSRGFYVRITAEDGTEQVYRYWQYISTTVTSNVTRGELTALSIGGVAVITGGNVQGSHSKGIAQGWWNKTVAPDFTPGEVTISAAQAANCAVSATVNNAAGGVTVSIAKISGGQWPLLENSNLEFGAASSNTTGTATFTDVADGDYIVIRQNASPSDASYKALFSHYVIKVNVTD